MSEEKKDGLDKIRRDLEDALAKEREWNAKIKSIPIDQRFSMALKKLREECKGRGQ